MGEKGLSHEERMSFSEKRPEVLVTTTEHIEMDLFISADDDDPFTVITLQGERQQTSREEESSSPKQPEHPLVPDSDYQGQEVQTKMQTKSRSLSTSRVDEVEVAAVQEIHIEMELFSPIKVSESELLEIKSDHPSVVTPPGDPVVSRNRTRRPKWKKPAPQTTGLVVKDVVCLPRDYYMAQIDSIPHSKNRAALAAMGLTARITIDYGWSASQMQNRLLALFQRRLLNQQGKKITFTYLKCVQGSKAWFIPDSPAEGWTGENVLRLTGHGPLYILSNHDYPEIKSDWAGRRESDVVER